MPVTKRMLCLANSKKMSGRCVAGREYPNGPWVRPVSGRPTEEISEDERQYPDGKDPRVLDILDVIFLSPKPHACQTENWLIDASEYWVRVGSVGWAELQTYVESPPTLWLNGTSTSNGCNDQIPTGAADKLSCSLYLIRVDSLSLRVFVPGAAFGETKIRVQGTFQHGKATYSLWVTDPSIERKYKDLGCGSYNLGESCLTVSLGEPFRDHRQKLIAAVIERASIAQ